MSYGVSLDSLALLGMPAEVQLESSSVRALDPLRKQWFAVCTIEKGLAPEPRRLWKFSVSRSKLSESPPVEQVHEARRDSLPRIIPSSSAAKCFCTPPQSESRYTEGSRKFSVVYHSTVLIPPDMDSRHYAQKWTKGRSLGDNFVECVALRCRFPSIKGEQESSIQRSVVG